MFFPPDEVLNQRFFVIYDHYLTSPNLLFTSLVVTETKVELSITVNDTNPTDSSVNRPPPPVRKIKESCTMKKKI